MNVSDQIIQVLDNLCEKFGLAIDWTSENVIPYLSTLCTKLVSYEIWTSIASMVFVLMLAIAVAVITKKLVPVFKNGLAQQKSYEIGWSVGTSCAITGLVFFCIFGISVLCCQAMDIIKCVTFPEMFIFEYVQGILNSGG